jgi:hypothetical protein
VLSVLDAVDERGRGGEVRLSHHRAVYWTGTPRSGPPAPGGCSWNRSATSLFGWGRPGTWCVRQSREGPRLLGPCYCRERKCNPLSLSIAFGSAVSDLQAREGSGARCEVPVA